MVAMADPRLLSVELDERTILARSEAIEQERQVAIADLLAGNHFAPAKSIARGATGPYRLTLHVADGRLALDIADEAGTPLETLRLGLARFRRPIRDYFAICDSYFKALHEATPQVLEPIDMARRAIHNDAATLLSECLEGKIALDHDTARRLFTLVCVLHIRG
jgi:uncharacterized protein (UPF0262 family)